MLATAQRTQYHERSLYMQGWSRFKQGRLEEGLQSFFGVLDLKVAGVDGDGGLETIAGLSRADRELVEDTFRVTSISLANLQGAESIPAYITDEKRRSYEYRVYEQLGELYLKQDRVKDAADTFGAFARRQPLHAQAPQLQARVIDIYQRNGFPTLALDAKKDYVSRYGSGSDFRRANPAGWEKAQPLVKTHLTELARHYHASAQKSKASADYQEAVRWYRAYIASYPNDPETAQNNFLLAELLYEDKPLRRGGGRVREGGLPVPEPRQGGRRRLRGAAELHRPGEARAGRGAGAAAHQRGQRTALRQGLPQGRAHRHRADQRVGEAVRAARRRTRQRGRSAGAQARPARASRAAPRGLDGDRAQRLREAAVSTSRRRPTARCSR